MMNDRPNQSEKPFFWGVSTSAFQIEGHIENDMTEWERQGGFRQQGKNPLYENATNHWYKWQEDFQLLGSLGVNAYRFSIEWARIQPQRNKFDQQSLDTYREMFKDLKRRSITPFLTLHHFTHPTWFHQICPWHKKEAVDAYLQYVERVVQIAAPYVDWYITFNEPLVWVLAAYGDAKFPPGEKNFNKMMLALYHILIAHRRTYDLIKKIHPDSRIGLAKNFIVFRPLSKTNPLDKSFSRFIKFFYNRMIIEAFQTNCLQINFPLLLRFKRKIELDNLIDFWGINYYYRLHVHFKFNLRMPFELKFIDRAEEGLSDIGWENYANGLYKTAKRLAKTGKPILITENGIATENDRKRIVYLNNHLRIINKIRSKKIDLRGYFYWSFLDNYEWLEGKSARFGLIHVDYQKNLSRTEKPSAEFYRLHIREELKQFI
jgi:beta-glucosidase